jgi:hypothetical protein
VERQPDSELYVHEPAVLLRAFFWGLLVAPRAGPMLHALRDIDGVRHYEETVIRWAPSGSQLNGPPDTARARRSKRGHGDGATDSRCGRPALASSPA